MEPDMRSSQEYVEFRIPRSDLKHIQAVLDAKDAEDTLRKLIKWMRDKNEEIQLMQQYQGEMNLKKVFE